MRWRGGWRKGNSCRSPERRWSSRMCCGFEGRRSDAQRFEISFADFKPPHDALCVERLRGGGAIVIGIGNSSEFACKGNTTNLVYGPTRNPLNPDLTPGGSSGGSVGRGIGLPEWAPKPPSPTE